MRDMAQMSVPYIKICSRATIRKNGKERSMTTLRYMKSIFTSTGCHHPSCVVILHYVTIIGKSNREGKKSEVSLLMDIRFLLRLGTSNREGKKIRSEFTDGYKNFSETRHN